MREEQPGGDDRGSSEEQAESERGAVLTATVLQLLNYARMQQVSRKIARGSKNFKYIMDSVIFVMSKNPANQPQLS
jgi:hypothetical protein